MNNWQIELIKALRANTGKQLKECKEILESFDWDFNDADEYCRLERER